MSKFSRIPLQIARISRVIPTISSLPPISIRNSFKPAIPSFSRYASSSTASSTTFDPQVVEAQRKLDEGNSLSEQGDLQAAKIAFEASLAIKATAIAHYNLGVVRYQLQDLPNAIVSFLASLELSPPAPEEPSYPPTPAEIVLADTHTNLGAAYILGSPPRPDLALHHLQAALSLTPDDGEVCYNLAAVLEASGEEEEALVAYQKSKELGINAARVDAMIRNIGAKILGKRLKEESEKKEEEKDLK